VFADASSEWDQQRSSPAFAPFACVAQACEELSHPRFDEAEPLFSYSLAIREKVLGKDDASVAESLNNLAGLLLLQRRFRCVLSPLCSEQKLVAS
jgi:hypothetical protein